jgi:threonine dehydrogenase-like Zn-dependent dehydrogenase
MTKTRAAVQTADRTIELQEFEVPGSVGEREALLAVEASGMCGSDWEQYQGEFAEMDLVEYPCIPGHEPIGYIEMIGDEASAAWGVSAGDRIAVEPFAPCGVCPRCVEGEYTLCEDRFMYAFTPTTVGSGLWGGYSGYMHLRPNTVVHRLPEDLPRDEAVLFNPLGAGFEWAYRVGGVDPGDSVLILGPGQRGLASTVACDVVGAEEVIVTGLERDAGKLDLAREFGATHTVNVEREDTVERVHEITDGRGVDVAIDVTPIATDPVIDAIDAVRPGGTVVLAGLKGMKEVSGFVSDRLVLDDIDVRGVLGVKSWAYERAIEVIESGEYPLDRMHSHTFAVEEVERAMRILGGEADEAATHITVVPE